MNRKGMLLASETLKMILSVISIVFLAFLLSSLYFNSVNSKNLVEAESTIERIRDVSARILVEDFLSEQISGVGPSGWTFFSYVASEVKPNSCVGENCLCICDSVWQYGGIFGDRQLSECDEDGICLVIGQLADFDNFEIKKVSEGGTNIELRNELGNLEVREL